MSKNVNYNNSKSQNLVKMKNSRISSMVTAVSCFKLTEKKK